MARFRVSLIDSLASVARVVGCNKTW